MKHERLQNLVEHAATGFSMPAAMARKIDGLARDLPRDFTYRRLARKSETFTLDAGERTDVSVITTDALDRENEVILPAGGDWSSYNRVVTFAHRYDQLPAGSNWWIRARGNGLIAKTHYPHCPKDWGDAPWLPSAILHLMQQPVPTCTGKSIGFLPLNVRAPTREELSHRPQLRNASVIDKWVGVEYAVVPVPCNPEAEMQAVAKGMEMGWIDQKLMELIQEARQVSPTIPEPRAPQRVLNHLQLRKQIIQQIHDTFGQLTGKVC